MKKTWRIKLLAFLALLVVVLAVLLVMKRQGFFEDPAVALRELKKLEIPATSERVREAALKGEDDILKILGRAGVDFKEPDGDGKSALHLALEADKHGALELIEEYGISPNAADGNGRMPLWYALEKEDGKFANWLVDQGADVNFKIGSEVATVAYYDAQRWDDLGLLLDQGAEANVKGNDGESLLGRAIRDGNMAWAQRFLHAGAEADGTFASGEALTSKALGMGRSDLAMSLLEAGANPDALTPSGERLIHETILQWEQNGMTEGQAQTLVQMLMERKADIESPNLAGLRPIQASIKHQFTGAQKLLLPKVQDVSNCLGLAMEFDNFEAISALLDRGASPDEIVGTEPPLFAMIKSGNTDMVTKLISSGASIETLGADGQRPLVTAIAAGHEDVILAMLNHERQPDLTADMEFPVSESFRDLFERKGLFDWYCRNERQLKPIHAAVMRRQLLAVERMIAMGADKFASTKNKVFPIQMAAANGHVHMQQLLIGVTYDDKLQQRNFIIDLSEQKVYYYSGGKLLKTSRVSSGQRGYRTPTGNYVITDKTKNKVSNIYEGSDMPYFQRFSCSAIGFHEGYTGSRYASHGCIRLPMSVAKYFWGQTKIGDRVTIRD